MDAWDAKTFSAAEAEGGATDRQQIEQWFFKHYDEVSNLICDDFSVLDPETALFRIASALPKCKAQTERQFREWAKQQVRRLADEKQLFEYGANLTLQDVLTLAASQPVRRGTKPFEYEIHGEKAFIKLEGSGKRVLPWIVPADWVPVAKALWPVHIRRAKSGPYVSKKVPRQRLNGTWDQRDLPVHHLFIVNCNVGDVVEAQNGNLLDWTCGNLRVLDASQTTKVSKEVSLESLPDAFVGLKPAKPTQIPRSRDRMTNPAYANWHERRVLAWLRGETS